MAQEQTYDAIVIGAGQSGGPLAGALASAGRRTALIEGTTSVAPASTKAARRPRRWSPAHGSAYVARRGADYGVRSRACHVDMGKVRATQT